jgi:hypothetical protein
MDVDYTPGILTPTNFNLLISGSAIKASIPDSNFTSRRHIIPRYKGSKSTSQKLNVWTPGDTGTFGKSPTVESLKTYVAYGYMDGSWAPERINASAFTIKYLIDEDGNILTPNLTQNSSPIGIIQYNFPTGDKFRYASINGLSNAGGIQNNYRTIIRGGYRIEPILYTQMGHTPPTWTSSISLIDPNSQITSSIENVSANSNLLKITGQNYGAYLDGFSEITIGSISQGGAWGINADPGGLRAIGDGSTYYVSATSIGQNIILQNEAKFHCINLNTTETIKFAITFTGSNAPNTFSPTTQLYTLQPGEEIYADFNINIPSTQYDSNSEFYFTIKPTDYSVGNLFPASSTVVILAEGTYWNNFQYPLPNPLGVINVGIDSIFDYPTNNEYNQLSSSLNGIIYIPTSSILAPNPLNLYYDSPLAYQQDIPGSGFNPITLPWSVKIGDEFRFEGDEINTYMVKKVFSPDTTSPERISNPGSLEVHLDGALPLGSINLDHFLIRRYIEDSSQIIFEGYRPLNGAAPNSFVITPEYIIPGLDKNIDEYVKILTEKGLLT